MKISGIKIENYRSWYGAHEFRLLDLGLVLMEGRNLDDPLADSNGSGKSALLDAIDWGLFGIEPRKDLADSIRNDESDDPTIVTIWIEGDDGSRMTVARSRGNKARLAAIQNMPDGTQVDHTTLDTDETQRNLERWLGLSRDVFHAAVFHGQTDRFNFAAATQAARMEILTSVLQLDEIDRLQEATKLWSGELSEKARQLETDLAGIESREAAVAQLLGSLAQTQQTWRETERATVSSARSKVTTYLQTLASQEQPLANLESRRAALGAPVEMGPDLLAARAELQKANDARTANEVTRAKWQAAFENADADVKRTQKALDQVRGKMAFVGGDEALPCSLSHCQEELGKLQQPFVPDPGIAEAVARKAQAMQQWTEHTRVLADLEARRSIAWSAVQHAQDSQVGVCQSCGQPVTAEHQAKHLQECEQEFARLDVDAITARSVDKQLTDESARAMQQHDLLVSADRARAEARQKRLASYQQMVELLQDEISLANLLPTHESVRENCRVNADAGLAVLSKAEETRAQLAVAVEALQDKFMAAESARQDALRAVDAAIHGERQRQQYQDQAARQLEQLDGREKALAAGLDPYSGQVSKLQAELVQNGGQKSELRARIDGDHVQMHRLEVLAEMFGPQGLKSYILDSQLQRLTDSANKWCSLLTGGSCWVQFATQRTTQKGSVKNEIDIKVYKYVNGRSVERNYKSFSGGEKQRVSLAVDFGLADLVASRATKRWHLLILDELFQHLDRAGKRAVVGMLQQLRQEHGTVLVVEHDSDFQDQFDLRLLVEKKNGRSSMVESGSAADKIGTTAIDKAEVDNDIAEKPKRAPRKPRVPVRAPISRP